MRSLHPTFTQIRTSNILSIRKDRARVSVFEVDGIFACDDTTDLQIQILPDSTTNTHPSLPLPLPLPLPSPLYRIHEDLMCMLVVLVDKRLFSSDPESQRLTAITTTKYRHYFLCHC
jgi:hypothetical protein